MMESKVTGNVFDIKRFALHDGDGIRTTIFLKGCPLKCVWCQNPEGIRLKRQVLYFSNKCIKCGICVKHAVNDGVMMKEKQIILNRNRKEDWDKIIYECPTSALRFDSKGYSVDEIMQEVYSDKVFYKDNGGITLSGGEPFYQYDFLYAILKRCKQEGFHTAIETTLQTSFDNLKRVLPFLDLIYVDVKLMDDQKHKQYVGATNKQILSNIEYLLTSQYNDKVIVRTPLIPNYTAYKENIERISKFLVQLYPDVKYELLNYNPLAQAKYHYIDETYCFKKNPKQYTRQEMDTFYMLVKASGLNKVIIDKKERQDEITN